eukprot:CAMPEP_0119058052 /NCGR_PEP_ID=MMETSP1178-20130426/2416_1 /TAXON_ID=33656 /ORGANISM="unid sp, Strain CCMP2000" /LENGTH=125 /DNA_ID=CAMNT_0007038945 /DNA_START=214 /DNA_END=588 /DNA_ORIENTATION=-
MAGQITFPATVTAPPPTQGAAGTAGSRGWAAAAVRALVSTTRTAANFATRAQAPSSGGGATNNEGRSGGAALSLDSSHALRALHQHVVVRERCLAPCERLEPGLRLLQLELCQLRAMKAAGVAAG